MQLTLAELARQLDVTLIGDGSVVIDGLNTLKDARQGQVSFLANASYRSQLSATSASAVIVHPDQADAAPCAQLLAQNPYLVFAKASQLFDDRPQAASGIHPSAQVAASAVLGNDVRIGANVVIGEHCQLGDGCEVAANTVIADHCVLGNHCQLNANVTLYHNVVMGNRVRVHSGAVIGADGFGFAPDNGRWQKIAQLGGVRIGDRVEIGANTCIDRGALGDTRIDDDVILDNLIQIAHNVHIGQGSALAGCVAVAGSTTIGKHCTIAGGVGIVGHLEICDGVHVAAMSLVSKSITQAGAYASGTAQMPMNEWRRSATRFRQLDTLAKRLQSLEKSQKGNA